MIPTHCLSLYMFCICTSSSFPMCACVLRHFSSVWLFATLWTVACQAPVSMGSSMQEDWSGLPVPSQHRDQTLVSMSPALASEFFTITATWEALFPDRRYIIYKRGTLFSLELVIDLNTDWQSNWLDVVALSIVRRFQKFNLPN